jgi:hypothetical protein
MAGANKIRAGGPKLARLGGNSERPRYKPMKYIDPQVTNVLQADSAIQGMPKVGSPSDTEGLPTINPAYRADE